MNILKDWLDGIVIAAVTALAIFIYQNYLHPFILGVLQRTPDLSGEWNSYDIDDNGTEIPKGKMNIKQIGNMVHATVHRRKEDSERVFRYKGTISAGQVMLIWKETKSNGYNMGTMTLLLSSNLCKLRGKSTFHHHDQGKIVSQEKLYKKISS